MMRFPAFFIFGLSLAACGSKVSERNLPEIARGLPANYAEGETIFDTRLKAKFPVGTDVRALAATLEAQKFAVRTDDRGGHATFSNGGFPVASVWNVGWEARDGKMTQIWGVYGGTGP